MCQVHMPLIRNLLAPLSARLFGWLRPNHIARSRLALHCRRRMPYLSESSPDVMALIDYSKRHPPCPLSRTIDIQAQEDNGCDPQKKSST
jgi:hypothetical protein